MSGLDDPYPAGDWDSFRAARERFLARVRPEATDDPSASVCPDVLPEGWTAPVPEVGSDPESAGD